MQEILMSLMTIASSGVVALIIAVLTMKYMEKRAVDIAFNVFDELTDTEEVQKKLYAVGALLGVGLKKGIGIQKPQGKGGWEGLMMQIAGGFINKMLGSDGAMIPQQQQGENTNKPTRHNVI